MPSNQPTVIAGLIVSRLAELLLALLGLAFLVTAQMGNALDYLLAWDVVALAYAVVGTAVVRWEAYSVASGRPHRHVAQTRLVRTLRHDISGLAFSTLSSLIGVAAAIVVVTNGKAGVVGISGRVIGTVAIGLAWLLLHVGFARFYRRFCRVRIPGGLQFPGEKEPITADYLYFAVTMGTTFATSDVTVVDPRMRWWVTMHSVLGFVYSAAVVAFAVNVLSAG